ncbi:MAG: hypothetical protein G01um101417_222 [Parcubacteria group bacterium Gr01-1014_17]|nr:MAG: hypothetical protein G01um101417_222 [Parcubacteria group bacterium Gr01-1014_17]
MRFEKTNKFFITGWHSFKQNFVVQRIVLAILLFGAGFNIGLPLVVEGTRMEFLFHVWFIIVTMLCLGIHIGYALRYRPEEKNIFLPFVFPVEFLAPFFFIVGGLATARVLIYWTVYAKSFGWETVRRQIYFDGNVFLICFILGTYWLELGLARMRGKKSLRIWPFILKANKN